MNRNSSGKKDNIDSRKDENKNTILTLEKLKKKIENDKLKNGELEDELKKFLEKDFDSLNEVLNCLISSDKLDLSVLEIFVEKTLL